MANVYQIVLNMGLAKEALAEPDKVARLLRGLADKIQGGECPGEIYDSSGALVGSVTINGGRPT